MASLLTLLDLSLHFGGPAILDKVNLQLEAGERVCLVGRNGAGKTTLMKVIMGDMKPDTGDVFRAQGAVFARLAQRFPPISGAACTTLSQADFGPTTTATRRVEAGHPGRGLDQRCGPRGGAGSRSFREASSAGRSWPGARGQAEPASSTNRPTTSIRIDPMAGKYLSKKSLPFSSSPTTALSCAGLRPASLNSTGVASPAGPATTTPTSSASGTSLKRRKSQPAFDKKLAQEEEWIRRGVRAQRSRATARINQLKAMRAEARARREGVGSAQLQARRGRAHRAKR